MKKITFLLFVLVASFRLAFAQYPPETVEEIMVSLEDIFVENENDPEMLIEKLIALSDNKINLNKATYEELHNIPFLSEGEIASIIVHRKKYGNFLSLFELKNIPALNRETIERMLPFITVETVNDPSFKDAFRYRKNQLFFRYDRFFQEKKGYRDDSGKKYLGDPDYYYLKYSFQASDKFAFGFTAEKDAGEPAWNENNKVFDFHSFYLQVAGKKVLKSLVLGDYRVTFGQGLVLGSGFVVGKSAVFIPVQQDDGIRKYSSTGESGFFRGIASVWNIKNVDFSVIYSRNRIDANISDEGFITSFKTDGLHRAKKEMDKKRNTKEEVAGGNIKWKKQNFSVGGTWAWYRYGHILQPAEKPYNHYKIQQEKSFWNAGIDYTLRLSRMIFRGEFANGKNNGIASLNSLNLYPSSRLEMIMLYRYYTPGYQANYAAAFGENSRVENEKGLYIGIELKPVRKIKIATGMDVYYFPWLKYGVDKPSSGYDWLAHISYTLSHDISMNLKYKYKTKEKNSTGNRPAVRTAYNTVRYSIRSDISRNFEIQAIVDGNLYSTEHGKKSYGWTIAHDFSWNIVRPSIHMSFRYGYFHAPVYDNRIYLYEKDVLYAFSVPAYYGIGHRLYLNVRWNMLSGITCYLKTGFYIYTDGRETTGSGLEEVKGNILSNIRCMVRYKF
jgi:hypothetical protein